MLEWNEPKEYWKVTMLDTGEWFTDWDYKSIMDFVADTIKQAIPLKIEYINRKDA